MSRPEPTSAAHCPDSINLHEISGDVVSPGDFSPVAFSFSLSQIHCLLPDYRVQYRPLSVWNEDELSSVSRTDPASEPFVKGEYARGFESSRLS